jgi:AraC family transcriptional regulator
MKTKHDEMILPILVYIQTHLEEELSLDKLSKKAGWSAYHFHRVFHETVGETLKSYVTRLKLEKAAFSIQHCDASLMDVSLELGFTSYETFSRSFKKHFGITPRNFSGLGRKLEVEQLRSLNNKLQNYEVSRVAIKKMLPVHVAFKRHYGSYLDVDVTYYDDLKKFVKDQQLVSGSNLLMGVGHDDPNITPIDKIRFDACIEIPNPVASSQDIGYQQIFSGHYAVMTYIGPYGETMQEAYRDMFLQMLGMKNIQIIGLPVIEVYRNTQINLDSKIEQTDIYLPVQINE